MGCPPHSCRMVAASPKSHAGPRPSPPQNIRSPTWEKVFRPYHQNKHNGGCKSSPRVAMSRRVIVTTLAFPFLTSPIPIIGWVLPLLSPLTMSSSNGINFLNPHFCPLGPRDFVGVGGCLCLGLARIWVPSMCARMANKPDFFSPPPFLGFGGWVFPYLHHAPPVRAFPCRDLLSQ